MLVQAGEQPVTALTGTGLGTDTTMSLFILDVVTKEAQERGLDENVYEQIVPHKLMDNFILYNAIDVYTRDELRVTDVAVNLSQMNVSCDQKLYNVTEQTFDFSEYNTGDIVLLRVALD